VPFSQKALPYSYIGYANISLMAEDVIAFDTFYYFCQKS
jgi:hypothetical protein